MRQETQSIAMPLAGEIGLNFGLPTHGGLPWSKMSIADSYARRRAIKNTDAPTAHQFKQIVLSGLLPSGDCRPISQVDLVGSWRQSMAKFMTTPTALIVSIALLLPASAQSVDRSMGRHLAETTCSACHQIGLAASPQSPKPVAPSFLDISRMPSTNELAIKVFLRSSHPTMPNIILSPEEIDSVAAYIVGLARK
jgi:mono/diheme cytochrome c family protein